MHIWNHWEFNNYESLMITEKEGVQTDCYGSLLIHILLKKLSNDQQCIIFGANPTAFSSLNDLQYSMAN